MPHNNQIVHTCSQTPDKLNRCSYRNKITHNVYGYMYVRTEKDTSLDILVMKGKASTAKQTCLGSLLELELNLYCVLILSFWRHSVNWTSLSRNIIGKHRNTMVM